MSHELRTPLNHIIGFSELILDKHFGPLNKVQREYLTDVHTSSNHLLSLINDILDLSKVEAGKFELQPSDVNLSAILESSLIIIKEKALKHGLQLSLRCADIPEIIRTDERKLKQILYNLLSNAMKFTRDGGQICLSANRVSGADLSLSEFSPITAQEFIEISVADTGIGINLENLERIFNSFEQVETSASRKYQGTGLGLSLTNKFVEMLGGRIWVESEGKNRGSKFNFIIPVRLNSV
jgi:signal transduction histidine kinase